MRDYILGIEASQDVLEIWDYIANDNIDAADRLLELLFEAFDKLAIMPRIGHRREDLVEDRPLLFWPVGDCLVIYRANRLPVEIVAVTRSSRDIPAFLRSREP
jgi:plasmid stabilization system protein ParE